MTEASETIAKRIAKPKILVADDNAVNQKVALLMLNSLGYLGDVVGNGTEVLEALRREPYDLILMDVQMPEMDGFEATRHIRKNWNPGEGPYIIAMTANAMRGDREACLEAGMDDYLSKPIRKNEMQIAIEKCEVKNSEIENESSAVETASFDFTVLDELAEFSPEDADGIIGELITIFFDDVPERLAILHKAEAENDIEQINQTAHTLKGMCATLGTVKMAALAASIEERARSNSLAGARLTIGQIEAEFENVKIILKAKYENALCQPVND